MKAFTALFLSSIAALTVAAPTQASWETIATKDKWGEPDGKVAAASDFASPTTPPRFPYEDLRAWILVSGCDSAYIGFTKNPNLRGGKHSSGSTSFYIDMRVNGEESRERMTQYGVSGGLWWSDSKAKAAIKTLATEPTIEVLVPLHVGTRVWKFDMTGAKDSIAKACPSAVE